MEVIGRNREVRRLKDAMLSYKSELIAVYGRRRVGKTFLIREVYKNDMILDFTGLYKGTLKDQLINFHNQLSIRNRKTEPIPKNWFEAFEMLERYVNSLRSKKKKVIFIDEFPWIATVRSKFLMWFENFWNTYCTKRDDLVVVICGSSASYMVNKIINNKGGLHNRISHKIRLMPFNLYETKLFLKSRNIKMEHYDILQLYMALGGIPHYLEKVKKGLSVAQNIDNLCFNYDAELKDEFNEVFASLFNNYGSHITIVKVLAKSKKGITRAELLKQSNMKYNGYVSEVLQELIESGFVTQYVPFGKKNRNSLFRLSDEYCMFYLKFIEPHKNQGEGVWAKISAKQTYKIWSGYAFETVCLKHIAQIKKALGISGVFSTQSSWQNNNSQIDLIIDRDDNRINLCEMKFYNGQFTIDKAYFENLRNKLNEFKETTKTRKGVHLLMLTSFGLKQNSHSLSIIENEITSDCLFEN